MCNCNNLQTVRHILEYLYAYYIIERRNTLKRDSIINLDNAEDLICIR